MLNKRKKIQIKSQQRVQEYGEVYTKESEVNSMIDLVKSEANKIEAKFLEPSCGDGNFLIKILERKIKVVKRKYKKIKSDYEKYSIIAVASIYGIDIQEDNVLECNQRLYKFLYKEYIKIYKDDIDEEYLKAVKYILSNNIICGDSLTGLKNGSRAEPIMFAEWSFIGDDIKRKDFALCDMIAYEDISNKKNDILKPRKEYLKINYKEIYKLE